MPRFFCDLPLVDGAEMALPEGAARHVQVLRLQPGSGITLFDGTGGEFGAEVLEMGRKLVQVRVGARQAVEREAARPVHLLLSLIASERFDWAVEKATELGAVRITPVLSERSSLRLSGERTEKKLVHWRAVAIAACEQCGRNRLPVIDAVQGFEQAIQTTGPARWILALDPSAKPPQADANTTACVLVGPEGGFSGQEQASAIARGWQPATLGHATLRAETAALAAMAALRG